MGLEDGTEAFVVKSVGAGGDKESLADRDAEEAWGAVSREVKSTCRDVQMQQSGMPSAFIFAGGGSGAARALRLRRALVLKKQDKRGRGDRGQERLT